MLEGANLRSKNSRADASKSQFYFFLVPTRKQQLVLILISNPGGGRSSSAGRGLTRGISLTT